LNFRGEAQALLPLLECGETIDGLRALIRVSPEEQRTLLQLRKEYARRAIEQRTRILAAFERIVAQKDADWRELVGK
jgi:hypothetical protein